MINVIRKLLTSFGIIRIPDMQVRMLDLHPSESEMALGDLIIVGNYNKSPKWAVFLCPGNCGHIFKLPLFANSGSKWELTYDWLNRPTLYPSVQRTDICQSHFWIKNGSVIWCKDSICEKK